MKKMISIALLWTVLAAACLCQPAVAATQPGTTSLVVKLVNGLSTARQAAVIARDGGEEKSAVAVLRIHTIAVADAELAAVLQAYQADPQVERIEWDKTRKAESLPSDSGAGLQWSLAKIGWHRAPSGLWCPAVRRLSRSSTPGWTAPTPTSRASWYPASPFLTAVTG